MLFRSFFHGIGVVHLLPNNHQHDERAQGIEREVGPTSTLNGDAEGAITPGAP